MMIIPLFLVAAFALAGCSNLPPRIIHICDFHFVSRGDFAADLRSQTDELISDSEVDRRYAEVRDSIERVQNEQAAILRDLIREHGVRRVFKEGVTEKNVARFRAAVDELPELNLPELQRRMTETEDFDERALLLVTIDEHRANRAELGVIGRLMLAGELEDVIPLEDAQALDAADPTRNGFVFDGPANDARETAMARNLVAGGPVAVVILGGGHDLADGIKQLNPRAVYQRIEPEAWQRAVGD